MDDIRKDIEESQAALKRLLRSPFISVSDDNRRHAEDLKAGLNRISTKINNYNELQSLDKMIDEISDNLEKEK